MQLRPKAVWPLCVAFACSGPACSGGGGPGGASDAGPDADATDVAGGGGGREGEGEGEGEGGSGSGTGRYLGCDQAYACADEPGGAFVIIKVKCEKEGDALACSCLEAGQEIATCRRPAICQARHDASERTDDGRERAMLDVYDECCGTEHVLSRSLLQEAGCSPTSGGEHVLP